MKAKARSLAVLVWAVSLSGGALSQQSLVDDRGVAVSLSRAPGRVVSLLPSLTECVCALGGCALLVGTDRFSDWPASVRALPKLGGLDDAQVESIAALKPDLVLASASARVTDRLESLGMKVIVLQSRNRSDVRHSLSLLAQVLRVPGAAGPVWTRIEEETRAAASRVPQALRGKRVYFEVDPTPYAAGAASFVGETLTLLGLANAVPAELGPFPKLNPEYVVRIQPDVIMAGLNGLRSMPDRPGWSSLKALRDAQTCGLTGDRYELVTRPGPRMGEAAGVLADCLSAITAAHRD